MNKGESPLGFLRTRKGKIGCGFLAGTALVLLGVLAFLGASILLSEMRGSQALERADQLEDSGHFAEAIPLFDVALKARLTPRDRAYAYGDRGWCRTKLGNDPEAIRDFNAALKIVPDLVFALLDRGLAFHRQGKFDAALSDYNQTIALDPNKLDAYRNRALIFANRGLLKKAIADMNEAVRCDPSNPRWLVVRGDFFLRDGAIDAALASYQSAIRLDPENADAFWGQAQAFRRRNQLDRGIAAVSDAIRLHPKSALLYFARGRIYLEADMMEAAAQDFDATILRRPDFSMAYANRGAVELAFGHVDAAIGYATRAIDLNSKLTVPYYVRGRAYDQEQKYTEAIADYDRALARGADFVWAVAGRALAEAHAGDYDSAQRDLEVAVRKFSGEYVAHQARAYFLASCPNPRYRRAPVALTEAHLAVDLSAGDARALDVLAMAYAEAGDFGEAQKLETQALAKVPESLPDRAYWKARLGYFQRGKPYRDYH